MVRAEAAARLRLRRLTARPLTWLDVFTDEPLSGNGLAVVADADDLPDAVMAAFARETRLSETTFVQTATREGADYRNRIFDPRHELPFAGHPSLGTAVAVAHARGLERAALAQQTHAGVQPIEVERRAEHRWWASMLQEPAVFGDELDPAEVFGLVGLEAGDAAPGLPPQVVSTGVPQVIVPVARPDALQRARPDYARLPSYLDGRAALTAYVVHVAAEGVTARSFAATAELGEDPATGSAAGPLCAYLAVKRGLEEVEITQGVAMGRPSTLHCRWEGDRPSVGGGVIVIAEGHVHL